MPDIVFVAATILFFAVSLSYVHFCDREVRYVMESMIMLAVSVLTGIYLLYALLRPEKF